MFHATSIAVHYFPPPERETNRLPRPSFDRLDRRTNVSLPPPSPPRRLLNVSPDFTLLPLTPTKSQLRSRRLCHCHSCHLRAHQYCDDRPLDPPGYSRLYFLPWGDAEDIFMPRPLRVYRNEFQRRYNSVGRQQYQ